MRDGPFIYFNILNLPFIDKSIKMAPLAQINDGLLDIIVMIRWLFNVLYRFKEMWEGGNCLKPYLTKIKVIGSKRTKDYK